MKWPSGQNLPWTHAKPTFSEAWFSRHCGLRFGREYHMDPILRTEQDRQAMRLLYDRFGKHHLGQQDPAPRPDTEICGHRLPPALLGCEMVYQDDQAPTNRHLPTAGADQIASIARPDLRTNPWAREFRRQAGILVEKYGRVDSEINYGGPLNIATTVLGEEAYAGLLEAPHAMTRFLSMVADLCIECDDQLVAPFIPDGGSGRRLFIGNCPVMMISPETYRDVILPVDLDIRHRTAHFGLHHCGPMDRYLADYRALAPIEYIEVGWGSDIAAVRAAFPDTLLDLMINVYDAARMSGEVMCEVIADMVQAARPFTLVRDVWLADVGPDVHDDVIASFVEAVDRAFEHGSD